MSTSTPASSNPNVTPMEALLGKKLLTKKGSSDDTFTLLKGKKVVALYFSASWCPPCKAFTPMLADFYKQYASKDGAGVEIVYVSSDKTVADFDAYYAKMPWLALPHDASEYKSKLATALRIQGIPSLVVLDVATGHLITNEGRADVQRAAGNAGKAQEVIAAWKATPPVPIEQGLAQPNDPLSLLKRLVMTFLQNPIYLFAILYVGKKVLRMLSGTAQPGMVVEDGGDQPVEEAEPIPDDEF